MLLPVIGAPKGMLRILDDKLADTKIYGCPDVVLPVKKKLLVPVVVPVSNPQLAPKEAELTMLYPQTPDVTADKAKPTVID